MPRSFKGSDVLSTLVGPACSPRSIPAFPPCTPLTRPDSRAEQRPGYPRTFSAERQRRGAVRSGPDCDVILELNRGLSQTTTPPPPFLCLFLWLKRLARQKRQLEMQILTWQQVGANREL